MSYDWKRDVEDLIEHFGLDDEQADRARQWARDHPDGTVSEAEELSMAEYANESSREGL